MSSGQVNTTFFEKPWWSSERHPPEHFLFQEYQKVLSWEFRKSALFKSRHQRSIKDSDFHSFAASPGQSPTLHAFSFARKDLCFYGTNSIHAYLSSTSFVLRYLFSLRPFLLMYLHSAVSFQASNHVDSGHILDRTAWCGANRSAISLRVEW